MKPFADYFTPVASAYAACRPRYPDQLFTYLVALAPNRQLAWDCAAGTGQASIPLAASFERVVASDISAAMLDQAQRHPRIDYRVALAESSGLARATVDLVTVAQALHWIDTTKFYAEAERVLVPGGVLAVWSYGIQELDDPALNSVLRQFYTEVIGPYWPPERRHVEAGYRTLPFPFDELEPPTLVMVEHWSLAQLLGYVGTWSGTQRLREATGSDPVSQLERTLLPYWGSPSARLSLRWPLTLRVGRRP